MAALLWTAAGFVFLLLVAYFVACGMLVNRFLRRKPADPEAFLRRMEKGPNAPYFKVIRDNLAWFPAQEAEDVYTKSFDGLKLHGKYLSCPNSRGTMLLVHGFHGSGNTDFSCVLPYYHALGFDLLVIDQRSHLGSEGKYLTMGVLERYDARSWCLYLLERFGESHPVIMDGISMGGSTVLMAAGLDLPRNVRGIIADCPFTSPRDIFVSVMEKMKISKWMLWGANQYCRIFVGFSIDAASTVEALKTCTLPLLIAHGEDDDFVPCWMGVKSFEAAASADKQLITVPGAGHGMSYLVEQQRMQTALEAFLDRLAPRK
ncbi:MAG: alpha/beta fold hydrolase [Clostridia bacterium]|nr:alpha/beta fold hydrolase [Clostridia bacterium]